MGNKLLIFDLDGTLIDSCADLVTAANLMRAHFGLEPLSHGTIRGYIGDGIQMLVKRSLQNAAVDFEEALEACREGYYANLTNQTTMYDGAKEGLRKLSEAGHTLAMLTNKPGDASRIIADHFGLTELFCDIIGGGDGAGLKPEPDGIFELMETSGIGPSETWMIGDHSTDLAAAKNASVKCAFVEYGIGKENGYKANAYFASFSQLVEYFV